MPVLARASVRPQGPTPVRVADASCARCHAAIVRQYLASAKANASGVAAERLHAGSFRHAASGVEYQVLDAGGEAQLRYARAGAEPLAGSHALAYFLGSGHLGTTYLYSEAGYLLESPVAFYARLNAYAMAPGLADSATMPEALPMTPGCMRCHMSDVQAADAGTRNRFAGVHGGDASTPGEGSTRGDGSTRGEASKRGEASTPGGQASARDGEAGLPFLHGGITCERCHGDATAHVASRGRAAILNPVKLSPAARDSVCSSCHLEGDASVEHRGRSIMDWRPGDDLADDVTFFGLHGGDSTERSVSETEELLVSRCKRESGARMSCMSCHDPHGSPPEAERVAFYRGKCLACHSAPAFAVAHFPAQPDCTGCHMPRGGAVDTPHVAWTDHRIRREPGAQMPSAPGASATAEVDSVLGGEVSPRDQALGYYKLLLKGQRGFARKAWTLMNQAAVADPSDVPVLVALGYMNQLQGRAAAAMELYRSALRLEPTNLEAAIDLGGLLAQSGRMGEARAVLQGNFARNADVVSLGINLSIANCAAGDRAGALATLEQVLRFSPDAALARRRLAALRSGEEPCGAAAETAVAPAASAQTSLIGIPAASPTVTPMQKR